MLSIYSFDEKERTNKTKHKTNYGSTIISNTPIQRRRAAPSSGGSIHSNGSSSNGSGGGGSSSNGTKMDSQFDSLKREATKLERNLEDKVARYQQVSKEAKEISLFF